MRLDYKLFLSITQSILKFIIDRSNTIMYVSVDIKLLKFNIEETISTRYKNIDFII